MPKHDAPWTPGPSRVRDEDGPPLTDVMVSERLLATAYPEHYRRDGISEPAGVILRSYAEAAANARLIAAAPALYQALQKLRDEAVRIYPRYGRGMEDAVALANGALALARGETK